MPLFVLLEMEKRPLESTAEVSEVPLLDQLEVENAPLESTAAILQLFVVTLPILKPINSVLQINRSVLGIPNMNGQKSNYFLFENFNCERGFVDTWSSSLPFAPIVVGKNIL